MRQLIGKWKQLSSQVVHQNHYFKVYKDDVIKPDGTQGTYHTIQAPGAAFIVPVDDEGMIQLIGLERYPIGQYSIEVPGGGLDGQDPLVAAKRELMEESGLRAKHWKHLGVTYSANGVLNDPAHVFLATGLSLADHDEQADEGISSLQKVSFQQAFRMVKAGDITDQQTVTALTLAALELGILQ
jgi:8-oxo-dGTP pyrophosphatase MutT (NUDIX family)